MSDQYVELLVAQAPNPLYKGLRLLGYILTIIFTICIIILPYAIIVAMISGIATYYVSLYCHIEYEYLYVDKELSIDRILGKSKRKRVETLDLDKLEIIAPSNSYRLGDYNNRSTQSTDYSSKSIDNPSHLLVMYYGGSKKLLLERNEKLLIAIRNIAPRKVFMD